MKVSGIISDDTLNILRSEEWYSNSLVGSWGTNGGNADEKDWLMSILEWTTCKRWKMKKIRLILEFIS